MRIVFIIGVVVSVAAVILGWTGTGSRSGSGPDSGASNAFALSLVGSVIILIALLFARGGDGTCDSDGHCAPAVPPGATRVDQP